MPKQQKQKKEQSKPKPKKEVIVDIHIIDAGGNVKPCKGFKRPNGKLLVDNPHYVKRKIKIEREPDT